MKNTKKEIAIIDNLNNERVATLIENKEIEDEIEEQRVLLQTYLASDMDIDEMDFNEVVNYAISDVDEQNKFIGHWKDYAYMRGKLQGFKKGKASKQKDVLKIINNFVEEHKHLHLIKDYPQEWEELKKRLKILEDYDTSKIKDKEKEMLDDEIKFLEKWIYIFDNIIMEEGIKQQMKGYIQERLQKLKGASNDNQK